MPFIPVRIVCSAAALGLLIGTACDDDTRPDDLNRARILAVRAQPPGLAAGQRALIDVLATGDDGVPVIAAPQTVALAPAAPGAAQRIVLSRESEGWFVTAPGEAELAALRAAWPVAADDDVPVPLVVTMAVGGATRQTGATVRLGRAGMNPVVSEIAVDGLTLGEGAVPVALGGRHELGARVEAASAGQLAFAWYTAVGQIESPWSPHPPFLVDRPRQGAVLLVVRDRLGGVAWRLGVVRAE